MEYNADKLSIDTPENILLDAEIAGFGSRFVAALIDYGVIAVLLIGLSLLFSAASVRVNPITGALFYIIVFLITWGYHLIFELIGNGQTFGKRRVGIRVIQANGLPATVSALLIRNIIRLFDFLPLFYGLGLILLFATKRTQRLGDLAARTVVIREQRQVTLQTLKEDTRIDYYYVKAIDPIPSYIQIDLLTQDDRRRVVNFLQRRAKMADTATAGEMLANQIAQKMEMEPLIKSRLVSKPGVLLEQVARAFEIDDRMKQDSET